MNESVGERGRETDREREKWKKEGVGGKVWEKESEKGKTC